jgi:hypothetical protein
VYGTGRTKPYPATRHGIAESSAGFLRIFFVCGGTVFLLGFWQIVVSKRGVLGGELWSICGVLCGWKCHSKEPLKMRNGF